MAGPGGVDASIALSGTPDSPPAQPNIFDTMKSINEIKLFNQVNSAKRKFGQIMATSPTPQAGIESAMQDPEVAGFIPDFVQSMAGAKNTMQEYLGKKQQQTGDAFTSIISVLPSGMVDPKMPKVALAEKLRNIPDPEIRAVVGESGNNLVDYLTYNLPADPEEARKEYANRVTAMGFATNTGDTMAKFWAQPEITDLGNRKQPILRAPGIPTIIPGQTPGGVALSGNPLIPGNAPGYVGQDAMAVPAGGPGMAGGNGLGFTQPGKSVAKPTAGAAAAPPAPSASGTMESSLGIPLYTPETDMPAAPALKRDVSGRVAGAQAAQVREYMDDFVKRGKAQFESAQGLKGQIAEMSHSYDVMADGGGWQAPGSGAELRLALGKLKTTLQTITGEEPDEDTKKVAFGEDFNKATQRMAANLLNTMYGQQREAAETIRNITDKGVPGITNSLMGGKVILGLLDAATNRSIEQYQWTNEWANRHDGDLRNADIEFNKRFPAKMYIDKALADMGVDEKGAMSPAAIEKAHAKGLFTDEQARSLLANKGKIFKE